MRRLGIVADLQRLFVGQAALRRLLSLPRGEGFLQVEIAAGGAVVHRHDEGVGLAFEPCQFVGRVGAAELAECDGRQLGGLIGPAVVEYGADVLHGLVGGGLLGQ